MLKFAGSNLF